MTGESRLDAKPTDLLGESKLVPTDVNLLGAICLTDVKGSESNAWYYVD